MAKYQKSKNMKKKQTFGKNILAFYFNRGAKELLHRKENEFDGLLLFSRVAGPAGRRDCRF